MYKNSSNFSAVNKAKKQHKSQKRENKNKTWSRSMMLCFVFSNLKIFVVRELSWVDEFWNDQVYIVFD